MPVKNGVFKAQYFNAYELQKVIFLGNRSMKLQRRGIDNKNIIIPLLCSNISGYNQLPEELKKECIVQPCSRKEATDGGHDKPYHKCHVGERNHRRILIVIGNVLGKGVQTICFFGSPCPVSGVWRGISLPDAPSVLDADGLRSFGGFVCAAEAASHAAVPGRGNQRVSDPGHRPCPECQSAFQ